MFTVFNGIKSEKQIKYLNKESSMGGAFYLFDGAMPILSPTLK